MSKECECCGNCCWNLYEDIDGWGTCIHEYPDRTTKCDDLCYNGKYVSNETKRHYLAVLLQGYRFYDNFFRQDFYYRPSLIDFLKAIKFAVEYIKQFEKI
jgi:hypothetical protein